MVLEMNNKEKIIQEIFLDSLGISRGFDTTRARKKILALIERSGDIAIFDYEYWRITKDLRVIDVSNKRTEARLLVEQYLEENKDS